MHGILALFYFSSFQKLQSQKGKAAEKSPQDEQPPPAGADVSQLNADITEQGNKVRDLKAAKAPKVII